MVYRHFSFFLSDSHQRKFRHFTLNDSKVFDGNNINPVSLEVPGSSDLIKSPVISLSSTAGAVSAG